ncbi:MAG: penicillin-insensitive murein endopeptidase [Bacteroidetes bacterium]|nr:penicillin-insensitive murein endopeptidase [Bacteroidota bacterium]
MKFKFLLFLPILSCNAQVSNSNNSATLDSMALQIENYYTQNKGNNLPSKSIGTPGKGQLINGKLIPFKGSNYEYFDVNSYLSGRAFLHQKVKETLLNTYKKLDSIYPQRQFKIMECANKNGGALFPHKTHQNGLSVDFMMPLIQENKPYYKLDTIGTTHYFITLNSKGQYNRDTSIAIDFNLVAKQILILGEKARLKGLKISKVIINTGFKDELFATVFGNQLRLSKIYIVKSLDNYTNYFHDDHFHIDFEIL